MGTTTPGRQEFLEYKHTYSGETKVFPCTLLYRGGGELVILYEPTQLMRFLGMEFAPGSVSLGYYWEDRNYNVYHWKNPQGATLLYYFNISKDTKVTANAVHWRDLIVDLMVKPEEQQKAAVLDEEELPEDMVPEDRKLVEETKKELLRQHTKLTSYLEEKSTQLLKPKLD